MPTRSVVGQADAASAGGGTQPATPQASSAAGSDASTLPTEGFPSTGQVGLPQRRLESDKRHQYGQQQHQQQRGQEQRLRQRQRQQMRPEF
jgi:hypothetical protein